jgi:hypothetical protein
VVSKVSHTSRLSSVNTVCPSSRIIAAVQSDEDDVAPHRLGAPRRRGSWSTTDICTRAIPGLPTTVHTGHRGKSRSGPNVKRQVRPQRQASGGTTQTGSASSASVAEFRSMRSRPPAAARTPTGNPGATRSCDRNHDTARGPGGPCPIAARSHGQRPRQVRRRADEGPRSRTRAREFRIAGSSPTQILIHSSRQRAWSCSPRFARTTARLSAERRVSG